MRPPPRRGADGILRRDRRDWIDRLFRKRKPRRVAREDGQPEVLGRTVAVLDRRSRSVVMTMMTVRMMRGGVVAGVPIVVVACCRDRLVVMGVTVLVIERGLELVDQRVQPGHARGRERHRGEADARRPQAAGLPSRLGGSALHAAQTGSPGSADWIGPFAAG